MTNQNYSFLNQLNSAENNVSKEEKIRNQAKLEVFETLNLSKRNKLKISDIAQSISKKRKNSNNIPNHIEIGGKYIDIKQEDYADIFDNYKHFSGKNNEEGIEGTDWALAQRLILDSGNMIIFENDIETAQKTFDSLNNDEKYKGKIELLQKKQKDTSYSMIKRTEEEQKKIEEIISKKTKEIEDNEKKQTEPIQNNSESNGDNGNNNGNNNPTTNNNEKNNSKEMIKESNEVLKKSLLVNRDNLAEKIKEKREEKGGFLDIDPRIEIRSGLFIDIKKDKDLYDEFRKKYLDGGNADDLEKLDTQFAERLILSGPDIAPLQLKYWIQINNDEPNKKTKSEEKLEKEGKDCEKSLNDLGYNVEYVKILNKGTFSDKFLEQTKKDIETIKEKRIAKGGEFTPIEQTIIGAKETLLEENMTADKIKSKLDRLQAKANYQPIISKRIDIYKEALENLNEDKTIYHIVRQKEPKLLNPHIENGSIDRPNPKPDQKLLPAAKEPKLLYPHIDDTENPDPDKPIIDRPNPEKPDKPINPDGPIIPNPVPPNPIEDTDTETTTNDKKERKATISNVESVHLEEANHRAEELARKEYEELGKLGLFNVSSRKPWARMKTFALRSLRRQQRRNSHLSSVKGNIDLTRKDVVFASDRHEMESNEGDWNGDIEKRLIDHYNPDIDLLCKTFLTTGMSDGDFESKFNNILRLDSRVKAIIGTNNMDYLASNILLKLKNEKAEYKMVDDISKLLSTGNTYNSSNFQAQLNNITSIYFEKTSKNYPKHIQEILNNIDNPTEIKNKIGSRKEGLNEDVKTLKMQLQLLDNTTGAYEINNKDKEKGFWYKFGDLMDKHPYLTMGGSILAGAGILTTGGLIGGIAGAATATGLIATKIGMMTAAKKASHYTKEQKGQEKRLTHELNIEKQAMENIKTVMNNAPWGSWRKYKAKRQFKLYQESTQKNVADTTRITDFINRFVAIPGKLPDTEEAALRNYVSNGLARIDYYKKIGHNFVASQDKTKVEIDMRNLYTALTQGVQKLGTSLGDMRNNTEYTSLSADLTTDYDKSVRNFKTQRRNLELKYGIGSGLLYAGTAVGLQAALGSGIFGNHISGGTETIVIEGKKELALHGEVKSALTNAGASQENIANIENAIKNAPASANANGYNQQAWRTIVKNEMKWGDSQLNSWMHNFMKDTLWTLNEGGASEFQKQLLDAKINILTANDPSAKTAEAFLSSPKIGLIRQGEGAKILADLQSWMSGKDIASFTAEEKIKMGYYGHMFIENNSGLGSRLTEQLTQTTTVGGGTSVINTEEITNRHYWFDGVGMPVFANTFMERMKPKKDEFGKPIESTTQDPVPDPMLVVADPKNNTTSESKPTYNWLNGK